MKEDLYSDLETRLRQDAERVLETQNHPTPIANLLQRYEDRKRRRVRMRSVGVLLLLAVVLPAAWIASRLPQPPPSGTKPVGKTTQSATSERVVVETRPIVPQSGESNRTVDSETPHASAGARPIILVRINADGVQESISGWYIPERSEPIDFSQLSPAQQRAVREVLGLEKEPNTRKPI